MQVAVPVDPELDLAALDLGHGLADVRGDRAGLGVGHQAARAEHPAEAPHLAHQVRGGDDGIEVEEPALDALQQVIRAHVVGAGLPSLLGALTRREHQDAGRLAGSVRQVDGAADHLVGLARVHAEPQRHLDGGIELGDPRLLRERHRLGRAVQPLRLDLRCRVAVCLAALHDQSPSLLGGRGLRASAWPCHCRPPMAAPEGAAAGATGHRRAGGAGTLSRSLRVLSF